MIEDGVSSIFRAFLKEGILGLGWVMFIGAMWYYVKLIKAYHAMALDQTAAVVSYNTHSEQLHAVLVSLVEMARRKADSR